ncbi:CAP domain-containing protein [Roseovarius sp. A21]|uniref:CAP domain-containing protein n=1 Tax=Roseovarius bejariae TaxID=2576383 RepID=A0A844D0E4_9RHOB|nr:CAP domain-containing protein [Roseovarius bejariae]MRU16796.1 CAP domain-containing protein [Roseovarius bejariae]
MRFLILAICALWLPVAGVAQEMQDLGPSARNWINATRADAGRGAVAVNGALTQAAAAHARDLAQSGAFSHTGSNGSSVGDRVRRQGYGFCFVAENIAKGQGSLEQVLNGWLASPGHRRNILASQAREFGLVRGPGSLWVMVLGKPGC